MSPVPVLTTQALAAIGYAIPLLFSPGEFLWLYGLEPDADGRYLARLLGAALTGVALLAWLARETPEGPALDAICAGIGIGCALGFVVALVRQLALPDAAPLGWTTVAVLAGFAAAHGALWLGHAGPRPRRPLSGPAG